MQTLLMTIVKPLVDQPDQVHVELTENPSNIVLTLYVAKEDLGKVIGKQGRIAKAIRTIMSGVKNDYHKRVLVEIAE